MQLQKCTFNTNNIISNRLKMSWKVKNRIGSGSQQTQEGVQRGITKPEDEIKVKTIITVTLKGLPVRRKAN